MQINCATLDGGQDFSGYVLKPAVLRVIQVLPYEPELPGGKKERSPPRQQGDEPGLVFIRWSIKLSNDSKNYNNRPAVATYTAKLSNLKQGYRTLPLLNNTGDQYLFSKLFYKIKVDSIKMMIDAPAAP
ncbi:hypothetical protein NOF04DRAFT_13751 [Fusarium oxysporum II5]|uniref:Phosphatidylinositol phospholipase C, gamma-1 n=1 Tax=Fusarium odoratissimum (strain NRRL 54006) TaxID=1089451 RepID=X0IX19_FUSO5|nr:phosphatidylinositol phospholipase C, gamma-1 [Fusarium odoratissimum NRRL 54006]EXL93457.1 phosphatidylinositol phospholipase C, gamma-1 [Fusarium odoratissimum NRRL 54006]KAK2135980.1 hypothetical protein NOF04DRAFT_13751 [Fusarium oxysporum II5]